MFLGLLTLITALTISAVAIYYSVAGLVAIFAAAAIPIIIMGSALEVGKLVTAVWLHRYWKESVWWLKTYLSIAVVVLMFITSMGIFGFLSKAHIDQTAGTKDSIARIEQIDVQITREQDIVAQAEKRIDDLLSKGSSQDEQIQAQIDREQTRIDTAYSRIQPSIDEQNRIIERAEAELTERIASVQAEIAVIDQRQSALDAALAENNIRLAQSIVGVKQDGSLGPGTQRAIQSFRDQQQNQRNQLVDRIESIRTTPNGSVDAARAEIQRLRAIAETEIADSNALVSRLRSQIGLVDTESQEITIQEQRETIAQSQDRTEILNQQKFELENEYRRLEAEVGPIKYIAEFVYGNTEKDLLEEAVRWVIIIIIFVFDPLAVLLLIASQYTFDIQRQIKKQKKDDDDDKQIAVEPGNSGGETESRLPVIQSEEYVEPVGTRSQGRSVAVPDREREFEILDSDTSWRLAKLRWKSEHPSEKLKDWKFKYVTGEIDELPWEIYLESEYQQNAEQADKTIWKNIKTDKQ
jgi:peptidoglycan hydrolase-like protein with peptidoglycan-binding domain